MHGLAMSRNQTVSIKIIWQAHTACLFQKKLYSVAKNENVSWAECIMVRQQKTHQPFTSLILPFTVTVRMALPITAFPSVLPEYVIENHVQTHANDVTTRD